MMDRHAGRLQDSVGAVVRAAVGGNNQVGIGGGCGPVVGVRRVIIE